MSDREDEDSKEGRSELPADQPQPQPPPRPTPKPEDWGEQKDPSTIKTTRVEGAGFQKTEDGWSVGIDVVEGPNWVAVLVIILTFGLGFFVAWLTLA